MRAVVVVVGVIDLTAEGLSCNVSLSMASGKVPVVVVVGKGLAAPSLCCAWRLDVVRRCQGSDLTLGSPSLSSLREREKRALAQVGARCSPFPVILPARLIVTHH